MKSSRIVPWIKGIAASCAAMLLYAFALGMLLALALLIIAMEEGGSALSSFAMPVTGMVVLLSQFVGFHSGSITVTIAPLLLTFLLILLLKAIFQRFSLDKHGYVAGLVVWVAINLFLAHQASFHIADSILVLILKTAAVFSVAFAWYVYPDSALRRRIGMMIHEHVSPQVRQTVKVGAIAALIIFLFDALVGLITLCMWIVLGYQSVDNMFAMMHMQAGSRVIMCLMALMWAPNAVMWAVAWLFGGSIDIGNIAEFNLWSGSGQNLPSLPIFGLLPEAVNNGALRNIFLSLPIAIAFCCGVVLMLSNNGFHIRIHKESRRAVLPEIFMEFACSAGAFCITAALMSFLSAFAFWISNGALGVHRLSHVGVGLTQATQVVTKPVAWGLTLAWLTVLVVCAIMYAIRWAMLAEHDNESGFASSEEDESVSDAEDDSEEGEREESELHTPRVVNSTTHMKENKGERNKPTPETSTGIGLS